MSVLLVLALTTFSSLAQQPHRPTDAQVEAMARHNQAAAFADARRGVLTQRTNVRPFYEYGTTGYLVFSDDDYSGIAREMKKILAQNLPSNVTLLVYTQNSSKTYQQQLFNTYANYIAPERLRIVQVPRSGANDFWSRDNTPIPVWDATREALVDAQYYYNFEPDDHFGRLFGMNVDKHRYFYEGGNFAANALGDCIVVNRRASYPGGVSDTAAIPDDIFKNKYGCKTLLRLKHLKGIGHADEVVKFMNDKVIVTDTPAYVPLLQAAGFTVVELPEPDLEYETYVNSLQVNDVLYVPIFGERQDQAAINIYKSVAPHLKIVTINTRRLATQGQGGIHCITMNYPLVPLHTVEQALRQ